MWMYTSTTKLLPQPPAPWLKRWGYRMTDSTSWRCSQFGPPSGRKRYTLSDHHAWHAAARCNIGNRHPLLGRWQRCHGRGCRDHSVATSRKTFGWASNHRMTIANKHGPFKQSWLVLQQGFNVLNRVQAGHHFTAGISLTHVP